ncbi:hypothetical protein [Salinarimonas chemoclinalis]|uniref:hypothetical protein n=1 Tax=Salinarimonas chemoclinalis TaxID=3241599 RepID=UPI00355925F7
MLARIESDVHAPCAFLLILQQEQFAHDQHSHPDIASLSKTDRLKHYGLHYAKYVGRLARTHAEPKSVDQTIVDTALICLSAANALHQNLATFALAPAAISDCTRFLPALAEPVGRFCDGCEKLDHLEDAHAILRDANRDVCRFVLNASSLAGMDLVTRIGERRRELARRNFFIRG